MQSLAFVILQIAPCYQCNVMYARMAKRTYNLREGITRNYRQLSNVTIPRINRTRTQDKLYPVEVVERNGSQVKIHYIGYDNSTDEWRELTDLQTQEIHNNSSNNIDNTIIQPYSLYSELRIKIKQALVCGRKQSPVVTIDMGFDYLLFKGCLQAAGIPKQLVHVANDIKYRAITIWMYSWDKTGITEGSDYAFVVLSTIEYYILYRKSITEYCPLQSSPMPHTVDTGYSLKFSFVRGHGNTSTFGKDSNII